MAANSATRHFTSKAARFSALPDRPSKPGESITSPPWRVVDRDGSTCDLHLLAEPQAAREEPPVQRHEADAVCRDGAPDEPLSEPRASLSDRAFDQAAAKSRQWLASFSPASAKREAGIPRSEPAPRLPEDGEPIEPPALPAQPESAVDLWESLARMVLKPRALDPDLCHLIRRWLVLPPRVREVILALIDVAAPP